VARSASQTEGLYFYIIKPTALSAGFVNESVTPLCEAKSTVYSLSSVGGRLL